MHKIFRVASFFSGIGGFDLGFERSGMTVVFQCEINEFCQNVLKKRWRDVTFKKNINEITPNDIPEAELWCGGFPCQYCRWQIKVKERVWKVIEVVSSTNLQNSSGRKKNDLDGLLLKMFPDSLIVMKEKISKYCYKRWMNSGIAYRGEYWMQNTLEHLSDAEESLLSEVLEPACPPRFFLTTVELKSLLERALQKETVSTGFGEGYRETDTFSIQHASIGRKHTAGPQAKGYRNDGETYTLDSRGNADAVCKTNDSFRMREITGVPAGLDGNRFRAIGNAVNVSVIECLGKKILEVERNAVKCAEKLLH